MIELFAVLIVYVFLALGAIAFLACVLIPPCRKYALSTALWFAVWAPCGVLFLALAVLGLVAGGLALQATQMRWEDAPRLFSAMGWGSVIVGGLVTCILASVAGWLHQGLIHRFTFLLFRLYATVVVAGIGCVLGFLVVWLFMEWGPFAYAGWVAACSIPLLTGAFGAAAYKCARALRGGPPASFTWITPDEFAGPVESRS